ncbi:MAG TPA: N-acetylmuramic acid 6-phosphate etherase, partial [Aliiroseovarius sp.]|nr:N-acetylmuramic acid 6-phosphate etherase [Aliiroseovarius sp.]
MTIPSNPDLVQLSDALDHLGSERVNAVSVQLDGLSGAEIATLMNEEDKKVTRAVQDVLAPIGQAIEAAARTLRSGGRVIYIGAGTSGRLGVLDASEIPPTFSAPPDMIIGVIAGGRDAMFVAREGAEDDPEQGKGDLAALSLTKNDFVVGLAASGRTPYVLGAIA